MRGALKPEVCVLSDLSKFTPGTSEDWELARFDPVRDAPQQFGFAKKSIADSELFLHSQIAIADLEQTDLRAADPRQPG